MKIEVFSRQQLSGTVRAVASKSHAHRLLIASAMSDDPVQVSIRTTSQDIEATKACLAQLSEEIPVLDCGESGSTLRFLIPTVMAVKDEAVFLGSGRLPQRPISPLKEEMEAHGCSFFMGAPKSESNAAAAINAGAQAVKSASGAPQEICRIKGRLQGGTYTLPGNISSQYITGLLFALPMVEADSKVVITSPLESSKYVDMTLDVLKQYNIDVKIEMNDGCPTYIIRGGQKYHATEDVAAEGDWSNIAFWVIAGILSNEEGILCTDLRPESIQGDKAIAQLAAQMGAAVSWINSDSMSKVQSSINSDSVDKVIGSTDFVSKTNGLGSTTSDNINDADALFVKRSELNAIEIDASEIPDLVPILAVAAATANGTTRIYNAGRLRIKESDRLAAMYDCLSRVGADITEEDEGLIIHGVASLKGGTVSGYNDHRIVMAMTIASIVSDAPIIIEGAEAINKSYPTFFNDFENLGGKYREL